MLRIPKSQTDFDIEKIAESGQAFRITSPEKGSWTVLCRDRFAEIRETADGLVFDCPAEEESLWRDYFDLDTDYSVYRKACDPCDAYLKKAVAAGTGIRILRQDPWETLISFIISQRKNIPAIMASIEKLSERFGKALPCGRFAFPEPAALASAGEEDLKACSLGYRVPYVQAAARLVESGRLDLAALASLDDAPLLEKLMEVPGVGPKVANCVSLFAYHRIAAFPVDVWIKRVVDNEYGGCFPLERYEGFAGVMQQYIFYSARKDR